MHLNRAKSLHSKNDNDSSLAHSRGVTAFGHDSDGFSHSLKKMSLSSNISPTQSYMPADRRKSHSPTPLAIHHPILPSTHVAPSYYLHHRPGSSRSSSISQTSIPTLPTHLQNPVTPSRRSSASGYGLINPDQLEEIRYRHALELEAVKRQASELREEKAFLVAQNWRLQRELIHEKEHQHSSGRISNHLSHQSVGNLAALDEPSHTHSHNHIPQTPGRPSFNRAKSQPNVESFEHLSMRIPHSKNCTASLMRGSPQPPSLSRNYSNPTSSSYLVLPTPSMSRRNSCTESSRSSSRSSSTDNLRGILKPTTPIRPLTKIPSSSNISVYCFDEGYESLSHSTQSIPTLKDVQKRHSGSFSRHGSIDMR